MSGNPAPSRRSTFRRAALLAGVPVLLVALTGCSGQLARFGMPEAATEEAVHIHNLWIGAWIASLAVGAIVWGLIGWSIIRYRRKEGDPPAPRQTTYHLPLELLYTLVPFLIIGVLFFYTVKAQDAVLDQSRPPEHTIQVIGQKWSWTFNYMEQANPQIGTDAHQKGTLEVVPELYLPVGKRVRFEVNSADVIHSFWVPAFAFKRDTIPGYPTSFDVTPTLEGIYDGKCAELCGEFHARMIFKVHVVSEQEYNDYVRKLAERNPGARKLEVAIQAVLPTAAPEEHK